MFAIDELKLNGFKLCVVPSGRDLFSRLIPSESPINGVDEPTDIIPMNQRTLDQLEYMDSYDRMMSERENVSEDQENNFDKNNSPVDET